jgi:CPA1 family monovalent cation:H+ antiporter
LLLHDMKVADGWWWDFALQLAILVGLVTVARFAWAFASAYVPRWVVPGLRDRDPAPSWRETVLTAYTGMRGVISLGAALAIPHALRSGEPFPDRGPIILLTFGVIVVTLVVQSLTLPLLVGWLGLAGRGDSRRCEAREARLEAVRAALGRAESLTDAEGVDRDSLEHLRELYRARERSLADVGEDEKQACAEFDDPITRLKRELIDAERGRLREIFDDGRIDETTLRDLERELDLEELRLGRE